MKDYYDIHMFLSKFKDTIDTNILKLSIKNTFDKRESFEYLKDYEKILEGILHYMYKLISFYLQIMMDSYTLTLLVQLYLL